jgi:hypothetical protein
MKNETFLTIIFVIYWSVMHNAFFPTIATLTLLDIKSHFGGLKLHRQTNSSTSVSYRCLIIAGPHQDLSSDGGWDQSLHGDGPDYLVMGQGSRGPRGPSYRPDVLFCV